MKKNLKIYGALLLGGAMLYYLDPETDTFWREVLIGIISSLILLLCIEARDYFSDRRALGYLAGIYKRESFNNLNKNATVDTKYKVEPDYCQSFMSLIYLDQGEYFIPEINYNEGQVKATIFLDRVNRLHGAGTYQYTKTTQEVDIGTYELFVNELDNHRLYIFHQNILPSGLSQGYEEWIKIKKPSGKRVKSKGQTTI